MTAFAIYVFGIITGITVKVFHDWVDREVTYRNADDPSPYPKVRTRIGKIIGFDLTGLFDLPRSVQIVLLALCGIVLIGWVVQLFS